MKPVVVLGGGGHAKVVLDALRASGRAALGVCAPEVTAGIAVPHLGDDDALARLSPGDVELVIGVGSVRAPTLRVTLFERGKAAGFSFARVVHPSAVVAPDVVLGEGVQVMAGAIVQPGCVLGESVIVNTHASVDHDCRIGAHTHLAPGVTLSGDVHIGERAHLGTGAVVIQGLELGAGCVVGAGAVVLTNVPPGVTVVGVPARPRP